MNRSTLWILLLAFVLPGAAMAAASSDETARLCPKGKPATSVVQEVDAPAAPASGNTATAKPSPPRSGATPAVRQSPQRWHSVLPGMIR